MSLSAYVLLQHISDEVDYLLVVWDVIQHKLPEFKEQLVLIFKISNNHTTHTHNPFPRNILTRFCNIL